MSEEKLVRLGEGKSRTIELHPALNFIPTGVLVAASETYRFSTYGRWIDGLLNVDADGWSLPRPLPARSATFNER